MTLLNITLSSLKRQKGKKAFLVIAMVLSFTTVLTLYTFTSSQTLKIENQFDEYGANIIITPKTDTLALTYGGISFSEVLSIKELSKKELEKIGTIPDAASLRAISPKLVGAVTAESSAAKSQVVIAGTDFGAEFKIKGWWDDKSKEPTEDNQVIIGYDVSEKMQLSVGDPLKINGRDFLVFKVLSPSGNQDDSAILARLSVVEDLLDKKDKISLVEISALCSECPIDQLVSQISMVLPDANVRALQEVMVKRMVVVEQIEKFALSISSVLILLCSLLVFSNIAASVNDRKHEIGIYRAIGFTKRDIIQIIQGEALLVSFFAGVIGILIAAVASYTILPGVSGIDSGDVVISSLFFTKGFVLLLVLGFISSLLPSVRASKIDPVQAINSL